MEHVLLKKKQPTVKIKPVEISGIKICFRSATQNLTWVRGSNFIMAFFKHIRTNCSMLLYLMLYRIKGKYYAHYPALHFLDLIHIYTHNYSFFHCLA